MSIIDMLNKQFQSIHKVIWIILLPLIIDIGELNLFEKIFKTEYQPLSKLVFKLGFISSPPSIRYTLEDFPSIFFQYNSRGFRGLINQINLTNILLLVSFVLITSFLHSGYLSVISQAGHKRVIFKDFLRDGNQLWFKFFVLTLLGIIPSLGVFISVNLLYLNFIFIILVYVQYSIVVDKVSLKDNFKLGISFLFENLGLTIKMAFVFGFLFSLIGIAIIILAGMGQNGIVVGVIITAYFGAVINKAVLEIYREVSQKTSEEINFSKYV
ncbi:hypothetical protein [Desulfosporosinus shakirovi]|uniref:hypothetical protein n=1 Tax=Desulfosporosinus shakirovi TaxID=2885154 RepID=UPI001E47BCDB|nr:hypothetical protein [Desulfosporosinus sp. SRJS8]MCB8814504.1 hypothetical protein [Desulfosporosinus sp. SRJS8]